jgi:hypothetical protein
MLQTDPLSDEDDGTIYQELDDLSDEDDSIKSIITDQLLSVDRTIL